MQNDDFNFDDLDIEDMFGEPSPNSTESNQDNNEDTNDDSAVDSSTTTPIEESTQEEDLKSSGQNSKQTTTVNTQSDTEDNETAANFYEYLKKSNYIYPNEDFEFDGSDESFETALIQTKENMRVDVFGELLERLPEDIREAVTFSLQTGGRGLNDYLNTNNSVDWDNLDLEDEEVQRGIMAHYYRNVSNFDDDKISKYIHRLEKSGDLGEEAMNVIEELKYKDAYDKQQAFLYYQQQEMAREEENKKYRNAIAASVDSYDFDKDRKQKIKNFLFNERKGRNGAYTEYNLALSNISANPNHMAQLADILLDYSSEKGFDFERFTKKANTSAVKNLKSKLADVSSARSGMIGTPNKQKKEDFDLESFLRTM